MDSNTYTKFGWRLGHWIFVPLLLTRLNLSLASTEILMESEFGEDSRDYNVTYTFVGGAIGGGIGCAVGSTILTLESMKHWTVKSANMSTGINAALGGLGGAIGGAIGAYLDGRDAPSIAGAMVGGQLGGSVGGFLLVPAVAVVLYATAVVLVVLPTAIMALALGGVQSAWASLTSLDQGAMSLFFIYLILSGILIFLIPVIGAVVGGIGGGYGALWGAEVLTQLSVGGD